MKLAGKLLRRWWPAVATYGWLSAVGWWAGWLAANIAAATVMLVVVIAVCEFRGRDKARDELTPSLRAALQVERSALLSAEARAATAASDGVRRAAILSGGHAIARYNLGSMYPAFGFHGEVPVEPHEFGQAEAVIDALILLLGGARSENSK